MYHELEPAYVLGDFALKAGGQRLRHHCPLRASPPVRAGTFKVIHSIARAFHTGRVSTWKRPRAGSSSPCPIGMAASPRWPSTAKPAGFIDAPPWECDVTKWVKRGHNEVEVTVIGTLKNTAWAAPRQPCPGRRLAPRFSNRAQSRPAAGRQLFHRGLRALRTVRAEAGNPGANNHRQSRRFELRLRIPPHHRGAGPIRR